MPGCPWGSRPKCRPCTSRRPCLVTTAEASAGLARLWRRWRALAVVVGSPAGQGAVALHTAGVQKSRCRQFNSAPGHHKKHLQTNSTSIQTAVAGPSPGHLGRRRFDERHGKCEYVRQHRRPRSFATASRSSAHSRSTRREPTCPLAVLRRPLLPANPRYNPTPCERELAIPQEDGNKIWESIFSKPIGERTLP